GWNAVFFAGFLVYVRIRHVYEVRAKGEERLSRRTDAVEIVLLLLVFLGSLLAPLLYLFTPWLSFADYRLPTAVPWVGTPVLIGALWLFRRSHADLGLNWSRVVELRRGHELVESGVYRSVRHPMYTAILSFGLA